MYYPKKMCTLPKALIQFKPFLLIVRSYGREPCQCENIGLECELCENFQTKAMYKVTPTIEVPTKRTEVTLTTTTMTAKCCRRNEKCENCLCHRFCQLKFRFFFWFILNDWRSSVVLFNQYEWQEMEWRHFDMRIERKSCVTNR